MLVNPHIFRAYDIRGIFGQDLTADVMKKIGFVLGKQKQNFLVGRDIRESGKELAQALIAGLSSAGAKVAFSGVTSFGETLFAGWKLKKDKILYITASHLSADWNGLKIFYGDGEPYSSEEIVKLRAEVLSVAINEPGNLVQGQTSYQTEAVNYRKEYINFLLEKFSSLKNSNLKVVLDCQSGSMGLVAPELFKKLGFNVLEMNCQPLADFGGKEPEPTYEKTEDLRDKIVEQSADFGVAFDGDGDRGVIIDDKGRHLKGDQVGIILAKNILKDSENKKVIASVTCSLALERNSFVSSPATC